MGPIVALFSFTLRQTLLTRRIWLAILMLAAPCALLILIRTFAPPTDYANDLWEIYHVLSHYLLASVLVPLVCIVYGTALIGAEVDSGTLVYLITRRMRRATVLVVKFIATALALAMLCDLGMIGLHLCALAGVDLPALSTNNRHADWNPTSDLGWYLLIVPMAVLGFLAVFSLISQLARRPMAISIVYLVVIELVLSNIPLRARVYSVSHYLRVSMSGAMPQVGELYDLPRELHQDLYPPGASGLPELFGIVLVAVVLAAALVSARELLPTKVSRE